jgi:hypothetical protein
MKKIKGWASSIGVAFVVLGLVGGAAAGYTFREPIKKALTGKNTKEEIANAVEEAGKGASKFQLEGVTTAVDVAGNTVTVKIKASTDSIKEMRLSDTPVTISSSANITQGSEQDLKIADIPIGAQVHMGGEVKDGTLTADNVIIQKEETVPGKSFEIEGIIKNIGSDNIIVDVTAADRGNLAKRDKDVTIQISSSTIIEKEDVIVTLSDIAVGDNVKVEGSVEKKVYLAAKVVIVVSEEGAKLEDNDQGEDFKNGKHAGFFKKSSNANSNQTKTNNGRGNQD